MLLLMLLLSTALEQPRGEGLGSLDRPFDSLPVRAAGRRLASYPSSLALSSATFDYLPSGTFGRPPWPRPGCAPSQRAPGIR